MPIEDVVEVTISAATAAPSRVGFGTPLILAYHDLYVDRVREYKSLSAMTEDGFHSSHPAYKAAQKAFGQNPRPAKVKVGRRAASPTQIIRLTPTLTTEGLTLEFTIAGVEFSYEIPAAATVATICAALTTLINAGVTSAVTAVDNTTHVTVTADVASDDDAIMTAAEFIGGAAPVTLVTTDFDGVVGDEIIYPARVVRVTFANDADWNATTLVVTGLDEDGVSQTEDIDIPDGGNATVVGTKLWSKFTQFDIPAQAAAAAGTVGIGPAAGALFSYTIDSLGLELRDMTLDPGIVADLAAVIAADDDWYGLVIDSNSEAEILAVAADIEARRKVFAAHTADTRVKVAAETGDVGSDLEASAYARTFLAWNNDTLSYIGAAWLGKILPLDPGSATWAFKTLAGSTVDALTETEISALDGKTVNHYTQIAGINVTRYGKMSGGEFIDITHGIDWLTARLKERIFAVIANNAKLPYTDASVDMIKAQIYAQLQQGVDRNFLAGTPAPLVTAPKVADVSALDKLARLLPDVEFSATLAGAIHKVDISGTLSV